MLDKLNEYGIVLPNTSKREVKVKCPNCVKIGKTHYNDKCLAVNIDKGVFLCHKCGYKGNLKQNRTMEEQKIYKLPNPSLLQPLNKKGKEFLNSRGITDDVIRNNRLQTTRNGDLIVFPYYRDGEIVNYKTRGIDGKFFTQSKDAEPIIYNYDGVVNKTPIVICEGEIDSLSWEVAGVRTHTSVNMGAPNTADKNI